APRSGSRSQRSARAGEAVESPMSPKANAACRRTPADPSRSATTSAGTLARSWMSPSARAAPARVTAERSRRSAPERPVVSRSAARRSSHATRAWAGAGGACAPATGASAHRWRTLPTTAGLTTASPHRASILREQRKCYVQDVARLYRFEPTIRPPNAAHAAPDRPPLGGIGPAVDPDRGTARRPREMERPRVVSDVERGAREPRRKRRDGLVSHDRERHPERRAHRFHRTLVLRPLEPPDGIPAPDQLAGKGREPVGGPAVVVLPRAWMEIDGVLGRVREERGIGGVVGRLRSGAGSDRARERQVYLGLVERRCGPGAAVRRGACLGAARHARVRHGQRQIRSIALSIPRGVEAHAVARSRPPHEHGRAP